MRVGTQPRGRKPHKGGEGRARGRGCQRPIAFATEQGTSLQVPRSLSDARESGDTHVGPQTSTPAKSGLTNATPIWGERSREAPVWRQNPSGHAGAQWEGCPCPCTQGGLLCHRACLAPSPPLPAPSLLRGQQESSQETPEVPEALRPGQRTLIKNPVTQLGGRAVLLGSSQAQVLISSKGRVAQLATHCLRGVTPTSSDT